MFIIKEAIINNEYIENSVTITLNNGSALDVTVPVKLPQNDKEVLAAIQQREVNENKKYDALPLLTAVKAVLDETVIGRKVTTAVDGKAVIAKTKEP